MSGTVTGPAHTGTAEGKHMSQPVIFVIDGDAGVTAALREDLDRRFGEDFRVIGASSAAAGLAALRRLADAGEPVALLIVDHHLSAMPGVEFLARGHEMHPLAKRVLLVERDYSARSPVIQAMTLGQADYHITKPWLLEQDLYRMISEFLAEWSKDHQAGFAVGDVRYRSIKRVASAVGDGATAVRLVHEYLATEHADGLAPAVST